jgi:SAM-dependent methyltransferase
MLHKVLASPFIWDLSRYLLDLTCGLYKKRIQLLKDLAIFKDNPSVLDVGCGTGLFAEVTGGYYVGLDSNIRSINRAKSKRYQNEKIFRCVDLNMLKEERTMFDVVLIVDILHHLDNQECSELFKAISKMTNKYLISFDGILKEDMTALDKWFVKHDQGEHFRRLDDFNELFQSGGFRIIECRDIPLSYLSTHFTICCPERGC